MLAKPALGWHKRHARPLKVAAGIAAALVLGSALWLSAPPRGITPQQLESMVQKVLDAQQPAPTAADAYDAILPSVVHVRGLRSPRPTPSRCRETQSGTGVVIVDTGIILTNLHVVQGRASIQVVFHDGLESEAVVIGMQPEHDLAVLQAKTIPDDLAAGDAALDAGPAPGRAGGRGGLSLRHRPVGVGRA